MSRSTALLATRRVTKILADLAPIFIKWPVGDTVQEVWAGFERISSFPKVIGALDDTHINIPALHVHSESYVNRKGHHSIQLQVCYMHLVYYIKFFVL